MPGPIANDFSLDDLMADGAEADALRRAVANGVAAGAVDPALAIQVADICCQRARPAMAISFVAAALRAALPEKNGWPAIVTQVVLDAVLDAESADANAALTALAEALDQAHRNVRTPAIKAVITAFADRPRAGADVVARLWEQQDLRASQAFLGIALAANVFVGDLTAARRAADLLAAMPRPGSWQLSALVRLALIEGDYVRAEELCRRTVAGNGERLPVLTDLAVALFCQGREDEGRQVMARSAALLEESDAAAERREQVAAWAQQFAEALAERTVDGGEPGRLGAALYYTHPQMVRKFYDAHRQDCTVENTYRTVGAYTNTVMFGEVEKMLAARPAITKVVNYGTLCGIREYELSARYPQVTWVGYDIAELATEWNRAAYARDNLIFESDFDKLLADLAALPGETLLVHCRTADIMLPEALRRMYQACRAGGVGHIMSAEYFCRRISTLTYPDFADEPVDAVHWDGILMVHNYAKILPEIGYRVTGKVYRPVPILVSANREGHANDQLIELVWAEAD